ncbi:hypothetical protein RF679_01055 [Undibacterium cyanobacteriorum]|uniref:Uncharacterized protein n=1 Tax=Undibacterium cyanobacteriorum TaxID=3073561 RepID=A0ABY9RJ70_9BURK|nr:hypothetical protein [Undibacterium sp. 20NA77.5]WMW80884.1 hypothetical protein RF679_01055 [Undibacterium sp. 20NA77.5]
MYKKARQGKIQRQSFQLHEGQKANLGKLGETRSKAQPATLMLVLQKSLDKGLSSQKAAL